MSAEQAQNSPDEAAPQPFGGTVQETAAQRTARWESERLDHAADRAIATCGGDMRSAIRALILANEFLQQEMQTRVSKGYKRGYDQGRSKTYSG